MCCLDQLDVDLHYLFADAVRSVSCYDRYHVQAREPECGTLVELKNPAGQWLATTDSLEEEVSMMAEH